MAIDPLWKDLIDVYKDTEIEFPRLKAVSLAQWIQEAGWNPSQLARRHNNFGGLKYRKELAGVATKVKYEAHDGVDDYCAFDSLENFIKGYWLFIDRTPYKGWRNNNADGEAFINFIAPIYTPGNKGYADRIISRIAQAGTLLAESDGTACPHCDGKIKYKKESVAAKAKLAATAKPPIKEFIKARYYDSGRSVDISRIVMHYTTAGNAQSTISEFTKVKGDGEKKTSSHYLIDKNGDVYQLVRDDDTAYHAAGHNANSIGIEHVARIGEAFTDAQEQASVALVRWLAKEYQIAPGKIVAHKSTKATSCPGQLFDAYDPDAVAGLKKWVETHIA